MINPGLEGYRRQQFAIDGGGAGAGMGAVEIRELQPLQGRVGVITGTSRGIGAEIAVSLAGAGEHVIGTHVDPTKETKQGKTGQRARELGGSFETVTADITDPDDRTAMLYKAIGNPKYPNPIDHLVLNAAGGLERGKPENWAQTINVEAQHALIDMYLPYMNPGGTVVYMTSLWAHEYGNLKQLPSYGPVASTKNRFEQELRERIPELEERGIKVGVVVGHIIKGTAAHTLFTRSAGEEMARLEAMATGGKFPEAADMGNAVRDMLTRDFQSGQTVYVGGRNAEPLGFPEGELQRAHIAEMLTMYSDEKLLLDTFEKTGVGSGLSSYTVRDRDTQGHFTGEFSDLQLFRGVDQLEAMAQGIGMTLIATEGDTGSLGVFKGVRGGIQWNYPLRPGMTPRIFTEITQRTAEGAIGNAEMRIGDIVVSKAEGIDVGILPNEKIARRVLSQKFSELESQQTS